MREDCLAPTNRLNAIECSNRVRLNFRDAILKLSYVGGKTDQIFHKHANLSTGRAKSACHLGPRLLITLRAGALKHGGISLRSLALLC